MAWIDEILTIGLRARWPRRRLERWRDRRFRDLVRHAARTMPFYRDLLREHGVAPESVRGLADRDRLPIVTRDALREAGERAWARDVPPHLLRIVSTSGSSGSPLRFPTRARDLALFQAGNLHGLAAAGWRPWHRGLALGSRAVAFRNPLARAGLFRWLQEDATRPVGDWIETWRRWRPHAVHAYPSALREICRELRARGERVPAPRVLTCGGETLENDVPPLAREVLGLAPVPQYGAMEAGRIAFGCSADRAALHVRLDGLDLEILRDGRPVAPGEPGEVHVTSFVFPTMPFIRYRLGDRAAWATEPCPCGRWWPRLEIAAGRSAEILDLPDGRRVPVTTVAAAVEALPDLRRVQIVRTGDLSLLVRYVGAESVEGGLEASRRRLAQMLPGVRIGWERVDTLPRSRTGKDVRYVDRRPGTGR